MKKGSYMKITRLAPNTRTYKHKSDHENKANVKLKHNHDRLLLRSRRVGKHKKRNKSLSKAKDLSSGNMISALSIPEGKSPLYHCDPPKFLPLWWVPETRIYYVSDLIVQFFFAWEQCFWFAHQISHWGKTNHKVHITRREGQTSCRWTKNVRPRPGPQNLERAGNPLDCPIDIRFAGHVLCSNLNERYNSKDTQEI